MKNVARTLFLTSVFSYIFFAFADYVRPGFVSDVLSLHLFLVVVILSGIWWVSYAPERRRSMIEVLLVLFLGAVAGFIVWQEGEVFGDARFFAAVSAFILPMLAWVGLSSDK